jgi:cysteine-rich repeat protein
MTAGGDAEKTKRAKALIVNAVIGLLIIMASYGIASFIIGLFETGNRSGQITSDCPSGNCGTGGSGLGGSGRVFRVEGVTPAGSGPGGNGWPRNSVLAIGFSRNVASASVDAASVVVYRCNDRAEAFDAAACNTVVSGTREVSGSLVYFTPSPAGDAQETWFTPDFWYLTRVTSDLTSSDGVPLVCPFITEDVSGVGGSLRHYCERATAFNDVVDLTAPTVSLSSPKSPPAYCAGALRPVPVTALASDDFAVASVVFAFNDGADNSRFVDAAGEPWPAPATVINSGVANPFQVANELYVDLAGLRAGAHRLAATATDMVRQTSATAQADFLVYAAHCCNGRLDESDGETAIDCGGGCGGCSAGSCRADSDCAYGLVCDASASVCRTRPVIDAVSPTAAGPGSLVTITGRGFGNAVGGVTFLGAPGEADDVSVAACDPASWDGLRDPNTVVVPVPPNAQSGPLRLATASGDADTTADEYGPIIDFTINDELYPGICWLEPDLGPAGSTVAVHGSGFGEATADSRVFLGGFSLNAAPGSWTGESVTVSVPPQVADGSYPMTVVAGGETSNAVPFLVRPVSEADAPRVVSVSPTGGPAGTYVTVYGSNFGARPGRVVFRARTGGDEAVGEETQCGLVWHDDYIVVKMPRAMTLGGELYLDDYAVEVRTAAPERTSNSNVLFELTGGTPGPGLCSITPDNGVPGTPLEIRGDNLGQTASHPALNPRFSVNFLRQQAHCLNDPTSVCSADNYCADDDSCVSDHDAYCLYAPGLACAPGVAVGELCNAAYPGRGICVADAAIQLGYGRWTETGVSQVYVPGTRADVTTWPVSGPVRVVSNGTLSDNTLPFRVQDCNAAGAPSCASGTTCCASGSCQESCVPVAKASAYGWLMSTEVLPSVPQVVERAACSVDINRPTSQSPSPYKGSTDACVNARLQVEFTRPIDRATLLGNLRVDECATGADGLAGACETPVSVAPTFIDCDGPTGGCRAFYADPALAYNGGLFRPATWYRVTISAQAGAGVRELAADGGQYLDGDFDRLEGGDYVWRFRTRAAEESCGVQAMMVMPPTATLRAKDVRYHFDAIPFGPNCNVLQCREGFADDYLLTWGQSLADALDISLPPPATAPCHQPVTGLTETLPGAPDILRGSIATPALGRTVSGQSEVSVQFELPRVVATGPKGGCLEACANSAVYAQFNVAMEQGSLLDPDNFRVYRCRNASCLPPYDIAANRAFACSRRVDDQLDPRKVTMGCAPDWLPGTYYVGLVRGGVGGVRSATGGLLQGTNDGDTYRWVFRIKDGPEASCEASATVVEPDERSFRYVGERGSFNVVPLAAPDQCSAAGQELRAWDFNWAWELADNRALGGFVTSGNPTVQLDGAMDTDPRPAAGCTTACTLTGSQSAVAQCGNGLLEDGEECEVGLDGATARNCSTACLWRGTSGVTGASPLCGNGIHETGETCEAYPAVEGEELVFPAGCQAPEDGRLGCYLLGAEAGGGVCGDGLLGEGESCDDGNIASGDGCSRDCLHEGSLQSCLDAASSGDGACANFCGNGVTEPGEDEACEGGEAACWTDSCLQKPHQICHEDLGRCFDSTDCSEGLGYNCGSSPFYDLEPSFCGDGVLGLGEAASCEAAGTDGLIDPYQVVSAEPQEGFSGEDAASDSTAVRAGLPTVDASETGEAQAVLNCSCRQYGDSPSANDSYCAEFAPDGLTLGCGDDSCCRPRPTVDYVSPSEGSEGNCRNRAVILRFSEIMDRTSLEQSFSVAYDSGSGDAAATVCGEGETLSSARPWYRRLMDTVWRGFVAAVDFFVPGSVQAAPPIGHTYCPIPGGLDVIDNPQIDRTTLVFAPSASYRPNTWYKVTVDGGAKSQHGVSLGQTAFTLNFRTGADVCTLDEIGIDPVGPLITDTSATGVPVRARAYHRDGSQLQELVPVSDYRWLWSWTVPLPTSEPAVLLREYEAVTLGGQEREVQAPTAAVRARNPAHGDAPANYVPQNGHADISVYAMPDPSAAGTIEAPKYANTTATVLLCLHPWPSMQRCGDSGAVRFPWGSSVSCLPGDLVWSPFRDARFDLSFHYCRDAIGGAQAGALLPRLRESVSPVAPGRDILADYLFTYVGSSGEEAWAGDAVGLRISSNLSRDTLREWYAGKGFTNNPTATTVDGNSAFVDGRTLYVGHSTTAPRSSGSLVFSNVTALTYSEGADERTVQVFERIAGSLDFNTRLSERGICLDGGQGGLPVRCREDRDCWVDDLGGVVTARQNRYACDQAAGYCAVRCAADGDCASLGGRCDVGLGRCVGSGGILHDLTVGSTVSCSYDLQCQRDAAGVPQPGRADQYCDAEQSKVQRDAQRLNDLSAARASLLRRASGEGTVPLIDAGSFIPGMSVSTWSSWGGQVGIAADPINEHGDCVNDPSAAVSYEGYDARSCWNSSVQQYRCPGGSHVYSYNRFGEEDFRLRADLETDGRYTWYGTTCLEAARGPFGSAGLRDDCLSRTGCEWVATPADSSVGMCQFRIGAIELAGMGGQNVTASACRHAAVGGEAGICGDGVVSEDAGEACEPGDTQTVSCTESGSGRAGRQEQICRADCAGWQTVTACSAGFCGDGIRQEGEVCDAGERNGAYGQCNIACDGYAAFCGDGQRQPNEACDCGDDNGQYDLNGVTPNFNRVGVAGRSCMVFGGSLYGGAANCSWDCQAAGPRCGDGVVNGQEECDGGIEQYRGSCVDDHAVGCDADGDCPTGACAYCADQTQVKQRRCGSNDPATRSDDGLACGWGEWTCVSEFACGNGRTEPGELCDDGNTDNTDSCVIDRERGLNFMCQPPRCGDYHTQPSLGEECDSGAQNGIACSSEYGLTCSYCTSACKVATVTGGFCGDGIVQGREVAPFGPEQCDEVTQASSSYLCVNTAPEFDSCGYPAGLSSGVWACTDATAPRTLTSTIRAECTAACMSTCPTGTRRCFNDPRSADTDRDGLKDNACDPDDDNDLVPDRADYCDPLNPERYPEYRFADSGGEMRFVPGAPERCNACDDNCNQQVDENIAGIDKKSQILFLLDASGTMNRHNEQLMRFIRNLAVNPDGVTADFEDVQNVPHATKVEMGLLYFVNPNDSAGDSDPHPRVELVRFADGDGGFYPPTRFAELMDRELAIKRVDGTVKMGCHGQEPTFALVNRMIDGGTLLDLGWDAPYYDANGRCHFTAEDHGDTSRQNNPVTIGWDGDTNTHRYLVVLSDEGDDPTAYRNPALGRILPGTLQSSMVHADGAIVSEGQTMLPHTTSVYVIAKSDETINGNGDKFGWAAAFGARQISTVSDGLVVEGLARDLRIISGDDWQTQFINRILEKVCYISRCQE